MDDHPVFSKLFYKILPREWWKPVNRVDKHHDFFNHHASARKSARKQGKGRTRNIDRNNLKMVMG
ncbi:hypothetical protein [Bartonella choladocola]|uniref:hypothetical protein n=1 Tax=Bartonella choladocola TaxID=2750995 RepID=UPI00098EF98D|nr:hypothetical protein [Bartonella choladocola]